MADSDDFIHEKTCLRYEGRKGSKCMFSCLEEPFDLNIKSCLKLVSFMTLYLFGHSDEKFSDLWIISKNKIHRYSLKQILQLIFEDKIKHRIFHQSVEQEKLFNFYDGGLGKKKFSNEPIRLDGVLQYEDPINHRRFYSINYPYLRTYMINGVNFTKDILNKPNFLPNISSRKITKTYPCMVDKFKVKCIRGEHVLLDAEPISNICFDSEGNMNNIEIEDHFPTFHGQPMEEITYVPLFELNKNCISHRETHPLFLQSRISDLGKYFENDDNTQFYIEYEKSIIRFVYCVTEKLVLKNY